MDICRGYDGYSDYSAKILVICKLWGSDLVDITISFQLYGIHHIWLMAMVWYGTTRTTAVAVASCISQKLRETKMVHQP